MRPILTIVVVLVLALGGYYVLKDAPDQPVQPRPGTNYPAPTTQRPQTGRTTTTVQGEMGEITVSVPDGFEARLEAGVLSWRDMVSEDYLVPMEDAWDVDLSGVDLNAEVLCVVDGVPITRDELRGRVLLEHGQAVVNARMYSILGKQAAAAMGTPYGLTDAEWDGYWNEWLSGTGTDAETAKALLSLRLKIPVEAVESVRREMVEAVLACLPAVESVDELPLGLGEVFSNEDEMKRAATIGTLMRTTIEGQGRGSESGGYGTPIAALLDPMGSLFAQMGDEARFRRSWTFMDGELPDGVLAGYYTGELDPDMVLPPWQHEGGRELILIDDLWDVVGSGFSEQLLRTELRDVVRAVVSRAKLAEAGTLPTPAAAWASFAEDYLAHKTSFFTLDMKIQTNGYPGRPFYTEDKAISSGILGSLPADWQSEEAMRDFFEGNRFFVLGWEPHLEVALFQPRDPRWAADRQADWDGALAQAQAFCDRVAAGEDFTTLRTEQNRSILEAYREVNDELADSFAKEFGTGEFQQTIALTNQVLRHSVYRDHVDGANLLRNAVVRLEGGDVSPPWKTPIGYVVVRMKDATMNRLEREYEDVEGLTRYEYEQHLLRKWAAENLGDLTVK